MYAAETVRLLDNHVAAHTLAKTVDNTAVMPPLFLYLTHQSTHEPVDSPAEYENMFPHVEPDCVEPVPVLPGTDDAIFRKLRTLLGV